MYKRQGVLRAQAWSLLGVVHLFDDSYQDAADVLRRALREVEDDLALRVQLLVTLSFALLNTGDLAAAARSVDEAIAQATRLGQRHLLSQALGMRVMLSFLGGAGLDELGLARALELEDDDADTPVAFSPSMQSAMLLAWTGRLDQARHEMLAIRRRCLDRGQESEWMFVAFNSVQIEIWRGDFTEATLVAEDAMERASQLGGDIPLLAALTIRAALAAYAGRVDDARRDTQAALVASQRFGSSVLAGWSATIVGFLEVSVGNYSAALGSLEPMLARLDTAPEGTEIFVASFVPDAVEALVALGRLADAEPLIDRLEANGRRLDRAWMLALGGRCRAMLLAARGDVDGACRTAHQAMVEHERLPMPFERARTQVLLGQLQRRLRQKAYASQTLDEALNTFEELGTQLWADRVRAKLARGDVGHAPIAGLTPSEQRVAELAATGMTNREVATALFISSRTVSAHLGQIYRKLGIRSRAELGQLMGAVDM